MTAQDTPKCPKCKSNEAVEEIKGCRCMSCPPWICNNCEPHVNAGYTGYEFFDDEDDDVQEKQQE